MVVLIFLIQPLLEARAEIQKYFRSFFGSNENFEICFWDLLTFRNFLNHDCIFKELTRITFLIHSEPEAEKNYKATQNSTHWCFLTQNEVGESDIKHSSKWSADVIEWHSNIFQTQIIESYHGYKNLKNWLREWLIFVTPNLFLHY